MAVHTAYPHTAILSLRIWETRGSSAKTTPIKLPIGVIGYGVSGFMVGSSERLVLSGCDNLPSHFMAKLQELLCPRELIYSSTVSILDEVGNGRNDIPSTPSFRPSNGDHLGGESEESMAHRYVSEVKEPDATQRRVGEIQRTRAQPC